MTADTSYAKMLIVDAITLVSEFDGEPAPVVIW